MAFVARAVKASWGIPCNQNSVGDLYVGKGFTTTAESQFGNDTPDAIKRALSRRRGDRNGRFWVDLKKRKVTMAVGESADNRYDDVSY
jgi:hypothetical protein